MSVLCTLHLPFAQQARCQTSQAGLRCSSRVQCFRTRSNRYTSPKLVCSASAQCISGNFAKRICISPKMIRDCAHLAVRSTDYKNVAPNLTGKQKKSGFALTTICALLALQDHCDCFRLPVLIWSIPSSLSHWESLCFICFAIHFSNILQRKVCNHAVRYSNYIRTCQSAVKAYCAHRLQQCQNQAGLRRKSNQLGREDSRMQALPEVATTKTS